MSTWLWLDDLRPAPSGWVWVRSVNEAIALMVSARVEFASLDHDLGEYAPDGGDATRFTDWMAEHDCWPTEGVQVHSANPIGVATMLATVDRYSPYPLRVGAFRGAVPTGGWPIAKM